MARQEIDFPNKARTLAEIVDPFFSSLVFDSVGKMKVTPETAKQYSGHLRRFIAKFHERWASNSAWRKGNNRHFIEALKRITDSQFETVVKSFSGHVYYHIKSVWRRLVDWIQLNFQSAISETSDLVRSCSLFCGPGGIDTGLEATGFIKTVLGCDIDPIARQTFQRNFPEADFLEGDIRELLPDLIKKYSGVFDLLSAGFPCTPYTIAGTRTGPDHPTDRLPDTVQAIKGLNPTAFMLENVPALASKKWRRKILEPMVQELDSYGYKTDWRVLTASDWGAATSRQRLIIVGSKNGFIRWPTTRNGHFLRPEKPLLDVQRVGQVIQSRGFGTPNPRSVDYEYPADWKKIGLTALTSELSAGWGNNAKILNYNAPCPTITCTILTHYFDEADEMEEYWEELFDFREQRAEGSRQTGRAWQIKLDENIPEYWLEDPKSPGRKQDVLPARSGKTEKATRLTPEEAAALQGFPKSFIFEYENEDSFFKDVFRQIGNSVPPPLAYVIGKSLLMQDLV